MKSSFVQRRGRVLAFSAAVVVSGLSVLAAARFQREPPPVEAPAPGITVGKDNVALATDAPQWKVIRLGTATASTAHWTDPLPARIQIDEAKLSRVGTPLPGRVTGVFVQRGQKVKTGEALFAVASPAVAELRAERDKANVDLEAARANLDRMKAVVAAHAAAQKELQSAQKEFEQAEVAARLAYAKLATFKVGAGSELTVKSPRDGIVVERAVTVGQSVTPDSAEPLCVVADLSTVWVVADLFEAEAVSIKQGTKATVQSPALLGATIPGTVDMVSAVVDSVRHTIPIRVRLDNPNLGLRPNVYAQVRFETPAEGEVEVLASAVLTDGTQSYVYVQSPQGRFVKRQVTVGSVRDGRVPVMSGLKEGEIVVEEGGVLLDNQIELSN
ncbi:MAG TPA: efflux RND transporter periplasmic adaptor subunit [Haliangiales bacterium]|nr:efflux RND transporter periplasmic adaptor subunit [Haliangiales bacterium]